MSVDAVSLNPEALVELSIEEVRVIQFDALRFFHGFCLENGLTYFLAYGTLLGAVRHGGYIPWDDDIDVSMPRDDYQRLLELLGTAGPHSYRVLSCQSGRGFPFPFSKLSDTRTVLREDTDLRVEGLGVNIDIFPLDGTSESRTVASCRTALLLCFHALRVLKSVSHKPERGHAKSFVLVVSKLLLSPFSGLILARALDHLARRITYASGERVRSSAGPYGTRELIDRSCYDGFVELNFEGSQFRAPVGYELLLCQLYGDFMALPPPEKRVSHHAFRAFRKT